MADALSAPDIRSGRLTPEDYLENFDDLHPPLGAHEASVEADRCYFCYDAPCTIACPTSIDIPKFIRQISTGNPVGSARTIFAENILGGMCARVCPTETLCEEACVRNLAEDKPVQIGLLQRHATDIYLSQTERHPFERAPETGRKVAVVGGGPAGLACAHALARRGHAVTIFDARDKIGGLNEFGIAAYKSTDDFAQFETEFVLSIGGIVVECGKALGRDIALADLRRDFDAVFLGMGLAGVNALRTDGEDLAGVIDAVAYIAELRQAEELSALPVGRKVVVIGGGMTAIDIAVQIKRLGAEEVTIAYRRDREAMKASAYEQELALTDGVVIREWLQPKRLLGEAGHVTGIELERTAEDDAGRLSGTGETMTLQADQVFKAIGQSFVADPLGAGDVPALEGGRIRVDGDRRTSLADVWAGGDCVAGGEDLTVAAVEDGKVAAAAIHAALSA
ncbi:NAD(P)-dependent oxidoreductase [Stappia taiwanensis]|uniref:dihydrouracil dehydrogenase (NAD(+)) n=1 Tax=Stappia taiwanensis TaxID=992267 RepID=A0A838XKG0_9HYPH|nr:NAD(P)-dependent oxidoreductase [Stappia taiwanensis]MBA4611819.1 NAD(P)-dependent oxidoreductase [Stappia taiwanensis]GGF02996.1 dihydropyrimidine dehydrogenase subunit A [Stappia taiwanensis]